MNNPTVEQEKAIEYLRAILPVGSYVSLVVRRVSKSGMSRDIDCIVNGEQYPNNITHWVALALSKKVQKTGGIRMNGCGMDQGFELVYNLGNVLFPDGFIPAVGGRKYGRNGSSANELDKDGGYALNRHYL